MLFIKKRGDNENYEKIILWVIIRMHTIKLTSHDNRDLVKEHKKYKTAIVLNTYLDII